jgi:hypothetical protein
MCLLLPRDTFLFGLVGRICGYVSVHPPEQHKRIMNANIEIQEPRHGLRVRNGIVINTPSLQDCWALDTCAKGDPVSKTAL